MGRFFWNQPKKRVTHIKKHSFIDRCKYRFDCIMAKGNRSMIKMLVVATLVIVLLITIAIHFLTPADDRDIAGSFWDTLASAVNAWMPYSDDGGPAYILLTALAAVTGLFFTSILIGIFAAAVEEKVTGLREGNSVVLERGHIVVLGFVPGEYTLIRQLIAAARGEKQVIVVAGDLPKSEMEQYITDNVEIPKHIRLICRSVPTGDIAALAVCSIPDCKTVVVNYPADADIVKATLAAYRILSEHDAENVQIISNVNEKAFLLPHDIAVGMRVICIASHDVIARVIAHSCTETGIAQAYADLFDIEGGSLRFLQLPEVAGKTFARSVRTLDGAVPIGVAGQDKVLLNPAPDYVIGGNDRLICWTEEGKPARFAADEAADASFAAPQDDSAGTERTVVIGCSPAMETLLRELPERPNVVTAVNVPQAQRDEILSFAAQRPDVSVAFFDEDIADDENLLRLLSGTRHVVILSDGETDDSDMVGVMYYIRINNIKQNAGLSFSVTLELRSEKNLQLLESTDRADFIVAPHIVAMFLAQLADCPEIVTVFKELLSNTGSEIHLKPASLLGTAEPLTCAAARARLMTGRIILLGYVTADGTVLNPALTDLLSPSAIESLIVISEA